MELQDAKSLVTAKEAMVDALLKYEEVSNEMYKKYGEEVFYVPNAELYTDEQEKPYTKIKIVDRIKEVQEKGYAYKNTKFTPVSVELTTVKTLPKSK